MGRFVVRSWLVHDDSTHGVELSRAERLRKEVGDVVVGAHVGHLELERLHHVPHEEVPSLHMLHAVVVLRVVGDVARALAVGVKRRRARLGVGEAGDELAQGRRACCGSGWSAQWYFRRRARTTW